MNFPVDKKKSRKEKQATDHRNPFNIEFRRQAFPAFPTNPPALYDAFEIAPQVAFWMTVT
jgi:hypothetical protein